MGPTGAIWGPRAASSPFSQSRSVGVCATSSWAQASSAASERIRMFFCMGVLLVRSSKKIRLASWKLQLGQGGPRDGVEQGSWVFGRVDRPGDFEDGAEPPVPGRFQLLEETGGSRDRLVAVGRGAGRPVGRFQPERRAKPSAAGQPQRGHPLEAGAGQRVRRQGGRPERGEGPLVLGADRHHRSAPAREQRSVLLAEGPIGDEQREDVRLGKPPEGRGAGRVDPQGEREGRRASLSGGRPPPIAQEREHLVRAHAASPRWIAAAVSASSVCVRAASTCARRAWASVTARSDFKVWSRTSSGSPPRASVPPSSRRRATRTITGPSNIGNVPPTIRKYA